MNDTEIQNCYLVVGRNRRLKDTDKHLRKIMGRKGIGKLAGFGLAENVRVITWKKKCKPIQFDMPLSTLKNPKAGEAANIKFIWKEIDKKSGWPESGTRIELSGLRHKTPVDIGSLKGA